MRRIRINNEEQITRFNSQSNYIEKLKQDTDQYNIERVKLYKERKPTPKE